MFSILFHYILLYYIVCLISQCFVLIFFMFHSNLIPSSYKSNSILFICIFISPLFYFIILRGIGEESTPELQRVLEQRKREQVIKQRKQQEEARRKISPLEQELLERQQKLEEVANIQS